MSIKKNIFIIIGISFIFLFISYQIYINEYDYQKQKEHNKIIESKSFADKYLGYIEIPKYKIKRVIKKGTNDEIIDAGYVGLLDGTSIDYGNTVLAGHNVPNIFEKLHELELNDLIIVTTKKKKYKYFVKNKVKIKTDNFNYFKDTENKTLTLITCTLKRGERLIVIAKEM